MHDVLKGALVIELGTMVTAPLAGMMLADMGARVIKVEQPETGDPFRGHGGGKYSPPFVAYNRNKESIQLDLGSDAGRENLARLLRRADVVMENFRPGTLERMGLDNARLRALNPRLVRVSITGFGASGPYKDRPSYDSVALALSGISSLLLDCADPRMAGPTIADNVTGMYAVQGALGALLRRVSTDEGGHVEVNMLEAALSFIPDAFAQFTRAGVVSSPATRVHISQAYTFADSSGRLLSIHLSSVSKFWEGLLKAINRPELAHDERFLTPVARTRNYEALRGILAPVFATRNRDDWMQALALEEVPAAPVYTVDEVLSDPHVAHMGTLARSTHSVQGEIVGIKCPVTLDGQRQNTLAPPPELNQDAAAIAREFSLKIG